MNTRQTNKLASYTAVERLLASTPEIAEVPGLPDKWAMLRDHVAEINRLACTQTQPIRASMAHRDQVLEELCDEALELAGLITSLARDLDKPHLAESVEVGRRAFRRVRPSHRLWFAQRVLDTARSTLSQLGPYGITAETLMAFEAQLAAAAKGLTLTRSTSNAKRTATEELTRFFRKTDRLLSDQIDRLVFRLRKRHPEFLHHYTTARRIVHLRGRRAAQVERAEPVAIPMNTRNESAA